MGRKNVVEGTVYLLCYAETPFKHAKHYTGFAEAGHLEARLEQHRTGHGARLTQVLKQHGITFKVTMTVDGTRQTERKFKNRGGAAKYCPDCKLRAKEAKHASCA